jgi:hypothetical protein
MGLSALIVHVIAGVFHSIQGKESACSLGFHHA